MEPRLIALKLIFDNMGAPEAPVTFDDRRVLQKVVYLAQEAGVPLGYHFGWYIRGPYSTSLTKDYFELSYASGDMELSSKSAPNWVAEKLNKVKRLAIVPSGVNEDLTQPDWLELTASLLYLRTTSRMSFDRASETLQREKPRLSRFAAEAEKSLRINGFIN